jgi:hypothetical protein
MHEFFFRLFVSEHLLVVHNWHISFDLVFDRRTSGLKDHSLYGFHPNIEYLKSLPWWDAPRESFLRILYVEVYSEDSSMISDRPCIFYILCPLRLLAGISVFYLYRIPSRKKVILRLAIEHLLLLFRFLPQTFEKSVEFHLHLGLVSFLEFRNAYYAMSSKNRPLEFYIL